MQPYICTCLDLHKLNILPPIPLVLPHPPLSIVPRVSGVSWVYRRVARTWIDAGRAAATAAVNETSAGRSIPRPQWVSITFFFFFLLAVRTQRAAFVLMQHQTGSMARNRRLPSGIVQHKSKRSGFRGFVIQIGEVSVIEWLRRLCSSRQQTRVWGELNRSVSRQTWRGCFVPSVCWPARWNKARHTLFKGRTRARGRRRHMFSLSSSATRAQKRDFGCDASSHSLVSQSSLVHWGRSGGAAPD